MPGWVVVKFVESEEVEAVPHYWYDETKKTVYYPPFPRSKMEKAIKHQMEPEANWQEYKVALMRDKIFDNFRTACSKATKSCITSEISDHETYEKRRPKKKKITSSEESSGSDLEMPSQGLRKGKLQNFICIYRIYLI